MQPHCNVIQSYIITTSAGKSNLDSARNFTSHYGVKTIVVQVVTQLYLEVQVLLSGVFPVRISSIALMIQLGAQSNPRGVRIEPSQLVSLRYGRHSFNRNASGNEQEEGVMHLPICSRAAGRNHRDVRYTLLHVLKVICVC